MRVDGIIVPAGVGTRLNREAWCRLIGSRPELRPPQPRSAINPFTRETVVVHPRDDVAEVVVDGVAVGTASWSLSDEEPLVNVSVDRRTLPVVLAWAAELGGEFREAPSPSEGDA